MKTACNFLTKTLISPLIQPQEAVMPGIKGFSLIEVLLSLLLITSVSLGLLAHQRQIKQFIHRISLATSACQILDQERERMLVKGEGWSSLSLNLRCGHDKASRI